MSAEERSEVLLGVRSGTQVSDLDVDERRQDMRLKKQYATGILAGLGVQLAVVNIVLVLYAWKGVHWALSSEIVYVWLGATVVEVIGVVLVITKHLFPSRAGSV